MYSFTLYLPFTDVTSRNVLTRSAYYVYHHVLHWKKLRSGHAMYLWSARIPERKASAQHSVN